MHASVSTPSLRVPFGLKDGQMVGPAEVQSGRACDCVCPGCGSPLQARKGDQNVWHFAHDGRACATGAETAVHLMAKQILATERNIRLPAVHVTLSATDAFGRERSVTAVLAKAQHVQYTAVDLEAAQENRRADAVGTSESGTKHWIEVFVRHAVDTLKVQDLEARSWMSYEICLDDVHAFTSLEQLRIAVTASPERVRWLSYPGMDKLRVSLAEKLRRILEAAERQKAADDAQVARTYAAQVRSAPIDRMGRNRLQRERIRSEQRLQQANRAFRAADDQAKRAYLKAKLRLPDGPTPALVDVDVRGHASFGVSRDVWQSDVFRKWVFAHGRRDVSLETILSWMANRYDITPAFEASPKVALWTYFKFLEKSGFVRHKGGPYFQVIRDVAPWLEAEVAGVGGWFWAPRVLACSLQHLIEADGLVGANLTTGILMELFKRLRAEHSSNGQPDDAARTLAQRHGISPNTFLAILASANVASCPLQPPTKRLLA
ncbi:competence protein CoiA family protein [Massilia sp. LC238]|jgi:hypothetical protein|uniref:competence protein CoiA family protein n=2 Tax=Pseudomonadota TaxID=1224 RepID=UPI000AAC6DEC|nr:competence protein CoiA family protein [Massilia sp. LC238]